MARSRPRLTLGGRVEARRKQAGLSVAEAARRARVDRKTWRAWETDTWIPDDRNHRLIEEFCAWGPGSVAAVLEGRAPTPLRQATVTPLRPGVAHAPPRDPDLAELVEEWRKMGLSEQTVNALTALYRAEKGRDDAERVQRYRDAGLDAGREADG